ncbi:stealth family protein [Vibrio renipiscarius]|uniref:stealth family protein n=1 Tax=Vibrio renipiscarius TaxID=1461322 RepID=UPI00354CD9D8
MNRDVELPIDVVLYWVDGTDENWLEEYSKFKNKSVGRFRDLGTLNFVLRGIEKNTPWVRHVHFVTNGQKPSWLNMEHPKLKFHTHEDIFYFKEALPVFNSSSIEANFSNIPGLSENFILFNDDMLVLKPLGIERFFKNNLPVDYLKLSFPRKGWLYKKLKPQNFLATQFITNAYNYLASLNIIHLSFSNLFCKDYKFRTILNNIFYSIFLKIHWLDIYHHPQPHLKSTWLDFLEENKDGVVKNTVLSKFRSPNDINQYLYRFINLISGDFYPKEFDDHLSLYVKSVGDLSSDMDYIFSKSLLCICEDENMSEEEFMELKRFLISELNNVLPEKSSYEI